MKRITVRIDNFKNLIDLIGLEPLFKHIERLKLEKIYRFDDNALWAVERFKFIDETFKPEDLLDIEGSGITEIELLSQEKGEYICLVKTEKENKFHEILSDFNLILDNPLIVSRDYMEISIISYDEQLKSIIRQLGKVASFKILNIKDLKYQFNPLHSLLSPKQREIIQFAINNGYFEIPRKMKSEEMAAHFNISVSALNEHLRKCERKIFMEFFRK
ncbi:MAG TPA: helix-turn-helix domain-containing protein [Candidatus Deferrimicrobium sp.]|nr:helix-turn-helix domain-containing protein [Candidatus Deferrimicrobium sp.]